MYTEGGIYWSAFFRGGGGGRGLDSDAHGEVGGDGVGGRS